MKTRVSVIIPTYNRDSFLGRTVQSVLEQGVEEVEVIVVDDGSTKDPKSVLKTFGDQVRLLRQSNQGVAAARNTGLGAAEGEFIVFLDDDDQLAPGMLRAALRALEANPEYSAVYGRGFNVDLKGRTLTELKSDHRSGDLFGAMVRGHLLQVAQCVFRRSTLGEEMRFDATQRFGDDVKFFFLYTRKHSFLYVPEIFLHRTEHPGMLTKSAVAGDIVKRRLRFLEELFGKPEAWRIRRRHLSGSILADWYRSDAFVKAQAQRLDEARSLALRSLRRWPWQPDLWVWLAYQSLPGTLRRRPSLTERTPHGGS